MKKIWLVPPEERETDPAAVSALDEAFHASLVGAAGNPAVLRCHQDVTERIRVLRKISLHKLYTTRGGIARVV